MAFNLGTLVAWLKLDLGDFENDSKRAVGMFKILTENSKELRTACNTASKGFQLLADASKNLAPELSETAKGFDAVARGMATGGLLGGAIAGATVLVQKYVNEWVNAKEAAIKAAEAASDALVKQAEADFNPMTRQRQQTREERYGLEAKAMGLDVGLMKASDEQGRLMAERERLIEEIGAQAAASDPKVERLSQKINGLQINLNEMRDNVTFEKQIAQTIKWQQEAEKLAAKMKEAADEARRAAEAMEAGVAWGEHVTAMGEQNRGGRISKEEYERRLAGGGYTITGPGDIGWTQPGKTPISKEQYGRSYDEMQARYDAQQKEKTFWMNVGKAFGDGGLGGILNGAMSAMPKLIEEGLVTGPMAAIAPMAGAIIGVVEDMFNKIGKAIEGIGDAVGDLFSTMAKNVPGGKLGGLLGGFLGGEAGAMKNQLEKGLGGAAMGIAGPLGMVAGGFTALGGIIESQISRMRNLADMFGNLITRTKAFENIEKVLDEIFQGLVDAMEPFVSSFYALLPLIGSLVDAFTPFLQMFAGEGMAKAVFVGLKILGVALTSIASEVYYTAMAFAKVGGALFGMIGWTEWAESWNAAGNAYQTAAEDAASAMNYLAGVTWEGAQVQGRAMVDEVNKRDEVTRSLRDNVANAPSWYHLQLQQRREEAGRNNAPGGDGTLGLQTAMAVATNAAGITINMFINATNPSDMLDQAEEEANRRGYRQARAQRTSLVGLPRPSRG